MVSGAIGETTAMQNNGMVYRYTCVQVYNAIFAKARLSSFAIFQGCGTRELAKDFTKMVF